MVTDSHALVGVIGMRDILNIVSVKSALAVV